ncbi:MAG: dihydrofolate reductase family protein [Candidatus Thermoplasmatota archaeon]|nr:dihydrofolate reductase family protein [Candidatus Thermoplasmatota archaeon]
MRPRVILHNSISLDGSLTGFEPDMGEHYRIAGEYGAQIHLIGSNTAVTGFELFGAPLPEEEKDRKRPERDPGLPLWAVIDTRGALKGLLHGLRGFEYCRDVVVLISEKTPVEYREYLRERDYRYHIVGCDRVDLEKALEVLYSEYGAKTVLCDTGRMLGNILLEKGLVSEVSLLVHPVIVGKGSYNMFGDIKGNMQMELKKSETFPNGCIWCIYEKGG